MTHTVPIISIIIPTLNSAVTIGPLICSITSQNTPVEIIIVDGGSTDKTLSIVNNSNATIKLYHETISPANARNIGIENSTGYYILFLDSDMELLNPNTLSSIISNPSPVTYIPFRIIQDTHLEKFISKMIQGGTYIYSRTFLGSHRFDTSLGFGEDRYFIHTFFLPFNIPVSQYPIGRHYPHTLRQLAQQAEWYGRTIPNYITKTKNNKCGKEHRQQIIYTIYNILFGILPILLILSIFYTKLFH